MAGLLEGEGERGAHVSASVRISLKTARALLSHLDTKPWGIPESCGEEIRREIAALARKSLKKSPARKEKRAKRETKKDETTALREMLLRRAGGQCESCCGGFTPADDAEMDHFWGRGKQRQSKANCWLIHRSCHRAKTDNRPDVGWWLVSFRAHACSHGYSREVDAVDRRLESLKLQEQVESRVSAEMGEGAGDV